MNLKPRHPLGTKTREIIIIPKVFKAAKKSSQYHIGEDRKERPIAWKGIPKDIIAEKKKADMCLKCGKGPYKWFECYAKNLIATRTGPKKGGVPQVRDNSKK